MEQKAQMILQTGRSSFIVRHAATDFTWPDSKQDFQRRQHAFTLIEVMLSVAILSVALVMILQAFAQSLSILRIAEDNLAGTLIAGNKMAEAQILAKGNWINFENGVDERFKLNDIECDWEIEITPVELEAEADETLATEGALNEVNALLSWEEGKRKGAISLVTYMRSSAEIDE